MKKLTMVSWSVLLAMTAVVLVMLVQYPIKRVVVRGNIEQMGHQALQELLAPTFNNGVLQVSLQTLKQNLAANTWIKHVALDRVWPDTLVIEVAEKMPFVRWGKTSIMDNQGELFTPPGRTKLTDLPYVSAPIEFRENVFSFIQALYQALKPYHERPVSLAYHAHLGWSLILDNGVEIRLGNPLIKEQAERVGEALLRISQERRLKELRYLDFRYPNGFVATYREAKR